MARLRIGWIGCGTHANEMLLPQLTRYDVTPCRRCAISTRRASPRPRSASASSRAHDPATGARCLPASDIDAIGIAVGPGRACRDRPRRDRAQDCRSSSRSRRQRTAAEAQKLADAAERAGVPVVLGFMKRYSTANRIAANVIASPEFGPRGELPRPVHDGADLFRQGSRLYRLLPSPLRPLFRPGALSDGRRSPRSARRRHELAPGKLLLHVDFRFVSGAIGTLVIGTHQSRGTPMEWWQVMGDHRRVEVRNVHEVRYFRAPPFKVDRPDATLRDGEDTLVWEPNLTVAANEDHKGYHALFADFLAAARGESVRFPNAADGARAMRLMEIVSAT